MKQRTRSTVFTALAVALTTVFTLISIALPGGGYYNFGDLAIFVAAIILGPLSGTLAGAIGAGIGDAILGYFSYLPFTLVIKALEGAIAGLIAKAAIKFFRDKDKGFTLEAVITTLGNLLGGLLMAGGYFLADGLLLAEGKWSGGIVNLPWNILQGVISSLLATLLLYVFRLKKTLTKIYIGTVTVSEEESKRKDNNRDADKQQNDNDKKEE